MAEMYNVARCNAYQGHCEMCKEENGGQCANWWWHEKWNNDLDWQPEDEVVVLEPAENQQEEYQYNPDEEDRWDDYMAEAEGYVEPADPSQ